MGAFFLVRNDGNANHSRLVQRLEACIARQEFKEPQRIDRPHYSLRLYQKRNVANVNCVSQQDGSFAFCTGTFLYRERCGAEALREFLHDFDPNCIDWKQIYGHFCVGVCKGPTLYLLVDRLGIYKVYRDSRSRVWSSSFLAVLESLDCPRVNTQAVYEYVFSGATYGEETIVQQIGVFDSDSVAAISTDFSLLRHHEGPSQGPDGGSIEDHLMVNLGNLRRYFRIMAKCFGSQVTTALSGGYDSRLLVALLREQGVTPSVYVYGKPGSPDVTVASRIAAGEGFPILCIDRGALSRPDRHSFATTVERNFQFFDGCPVEGIFDNGSDLTTRLERCADGKLMLNGSGGEVFRIFFPIADVRLSVPQFLRRCYADYDRSSCSSLFSAQEYLGALATKLANARRGDGGMLERREIERLYVDFRCRYWGGRNTSVNNRVSWALTPYVDANIVESAHRIPLRYKKYGRFEARMICEVNAALAGYLSVYGHDFAHEPPLRRKVGDIATTLYKTYFPGANVFRFLTALRQRKRGRRAFAHCLQPEFIKSVIDPACPRLSRLFRIERVSDSAQYARICTLEYLFQRYDAVVAGDRR